MPSEKFSSGTQNRLVSHTEEKAQSLAVTGIEPYLLQNLRFTTNYDLVLDDLVYRKVKHLHGGFNFSSPYKREKVPCGKGNYNIITAADGYKKNKCMVKNGITMYQKYLNQLEKGDYKEIYILGYSGYNDEHINGAIKRNGNIKRINVYVSPNDVFNEKKIKHYYIKFCSNRNVDEIIADNISEITKKNGRTLCLLNWEEFWNHIQTDKRRI